MDLVSRVLFPTPESSYTVDDFPGELIWVPKSLDPTTSTPEECIPCMFLMSPSARFVVFYLHSNAEDLGRCYPFCALLRYQFQVHVLAVEYPGYGLCPGPQADEESVTENAQVAFRFIREVLEWPLDGIIIMGRSVGTGPALALAVQQEVYGVVLISPFLSVKEVCRDLVGPLANLITDRFPNKDRVPMLRSPLLVVHGKKDVVVPVSHGEKLYAACRSRKRLVCPETMSHNTNLHVDANFFVLPMLQFFSLPDYCFEELRVPIWAYDKKLSTHYKFRKGGDRFPEPKLGHNRNDPEGQEEESRPPFANKHVASQPIYGNGGAPAIIIGQQTNLGPASDVYRQTNRNAWNSSSVPGRSSIGPQLVPLRQVPANTTKPDAPMPHVDVLMPHMPIAGSGKPQALAEPQESTDDLSPGDRGTEDTTSSSVAKHLATNGRLTPAEVAPLPKERSTIDDQLPDTPNEGFFFKVPHTRCNGPALSERSECNLAVLRELDCTDIAI